MIGDRIYNIDPMDKKRWNDKRSKVQMISTYISNKTNILKFVNKKNI